MEKMWMRSVVTLALCLSIAACGKSKDGGSSSPAAPAKPVVTDANPGSTVQDPKGTPATGAPDSGLPVPGTSSPDLKDGNKDGKDLKGNDRSNDKDQPKPRLQEKGQKDSSQKPSGSPGSSASTQNSNKIKPSIEVSNPEVDRQDPNEDRYSGAAEDGLREYLTALQKEDSSVSAQQKQRNLKFARSISKASLRLNTQTGVVQIVLRLGSTGKVVDLNLTGKAQSNQKTFQLTSKSRSLSAKLTCMDTASGSGQTCATSLGEVKYNGDSVQVIFRTTALEIGFAFPPHNCFSPECDELYNLSRYTERQIIEPNTLKTAVMDSYEVVQGKSAFKILLVTNKSEVIKLAGPLANPEMFPVLDTPVDQSLTADEMTDPQTHEIRKTRLNEALHDVRLTSNDGLGQLNFFVKMKILADGTRDDFQIRVTRKTPPISTPVQVELK